MILVLVFRVNFSLISYILSLRFKRRAILFGNLVLKINYRKNSEWSVSKIGNRV